MKDAASKDRVDRWLTAFNEQDAEGIIALFSADGYIEDVPLATVAHVGKDLKEFLDFNFAAFPSWQFKIESWDGGETSTVIEWTMSCPRMGEIPGMSAEGKPAKIRGVTVQVLDSGKIKSQTDYWDCADLLRQTGDLAA